jgi:hypothetical protein
LNRDEILAASLPNSSDSGFLQEPGETIKFIANSLVILEEASYELGTFTLTDRRYAFTGAGSKVHVELSSVVSVSIGNDYLFGLSSTDYGVPSSFYDLLKITDASGTLHTFVFLRSDTASLQAVGEAILSLKGGKKLQASDQQPGAQRTVVIQREIVKVPCRYCGTLNEIATAKTCSNCGAPLR